MKKLLSLILVSLCLLAPVAPLALVSGCATTPAETVAYFTIKDSWVLSKTAMDKFSERVVLGKIHEEKVARVDAAWNHYRATLQSAITLSRRDWSAKASDNLIVIQNELLKLIAEFS